MSVKNHLKDAIDSYREQILDAIVQLQPRKPFAAMTLACCAVDLLAHTLYEPAEDNDSQRTAFERVIRDKIGYSNSGLASVIYDLRCGLVHEFRTAGSSGRVMFSNEFKKEEPLRDGDVWTVSVTDFCGKVIAAFEELFKEMTNDRSLAKSFVERAYIHVQPLTAAPEGTPRWASTVSAAASGTGWFNAAKFEPNDD